MNLFISCILGLSLWFINVAGCGRSGSGDLLCSDITQNTPFTAKINEEWCLNDWKITFGPMVEDSRCNVPGIECVWAGRYVLAATIENGQIVNDTFFAVHDWRDTIYSGNYQVILNKVFPETRPTTDPLDTSAYSFEIIVK